MPFYDGENASRKISYGVDLPAFSNHPAGLQT